MGTLSIGTVLSQPCCGHFQGHAVTKRLVAAPYCKSGNGILTSANSSVFPSNFLYVNSKYSSLKNPCYRNGTRLVIKAKAKADYYSVLGVDKDASKSEIKTAYRRLARNFHPDVNKEPNAEQRFKEIGNAYEVLSDEEKRTIYDRYGEDGLNGSAGMGGYGNPFDMFESFFGGGFSSMNMGGEGFTNGNEGDDLLYNLKLNFKEAVFGVEKEIEINRLDKCTTCEGSGAKPGTRSHVCRSCRGQGQVISSARTPLGIFQQVTTCPTCEGTGETLTPCKKCKGDGRVRKYKKVKVNVPPGVDTGNQLRVKLEGDAGWRGGVNGDLFVALEVRPDPVLRREGNNILYTGKISYTDAILGTIMNVPSLDGTVELRVSPGTQPGAVLVMDKKGVPFLNKRNRRGDQLVKVQVEIPKRIGEEERKIIEDLASLNKAKVGSTRKVQA